MLPTGGRGMISNTVHPCWIVQVPWIGEQRSSRRIVESQQQWFLRSHHPKIFHHRSCPHTVRRLCVGSGSEKTRFVAVTTYRCRVRFRRPRLIIYIEDPKEAFSVDHVYIEKDTEAEKTTVADIITISYPIRSNTMSIINQDAGQVSIQQKRDNMHILSINNIPNTQESRLYQPSIKVFLLYRKEQKIFQTIIKKK